MKRFAAKGKYRCNFVGTQTRESRGRGGEDTAPRHPTASTAWQQGCHPAGSQHREGRGQDKRGLCTRQGQPAKTGGDVGWQLSGGSPLLGGGAAPLCPCAAGRQDPAAHRLPEHRWGFLLWFASSLFQRPEKDAPALGSLPCEGHQQAAGGDSAPGQNPPGNRGRGDISAGSSLPPAPSSPPMSPHPGFIFIASLEKDF